MSTPDFSTLVARHRNYFRTGGTRSAEWRERQLTAIKAMMTDRAADFHAALWTDLRRNRTDADLTVLNGALREMKKRLPRPSDVTDPDLRFHEAIAAASHNRLLERLMNCLRDAISEMMNVAWPGQPDMNASYEMHVRVAVAIRKKDAHGAREAMAKHMEGMTRELREVGLLP